MAGKHGVPITDGGRRKPVKPDDAIEESVGDGRVRVGWPRAMKCAYLEKRSTTVRMTNLSPTFGSPSMKSIEISAHTWDGTSSGCSNPAG
jgi:hypothetical protein